MGVFLRLSGCRQDWLGEIFGGELFMSVAARKYKNRNELTYLKGVFARYSEAVIYVKREMSMEG